MTCSDPNVLFGTTLIVPNAVARGEADGVDVRLDLPRRRGVSGYISYTNAHVTNFGPVTGGLFFEDEVIEIADGTEFTPDHDQRHVGAFGATTIIRAEASGCRSAGATKAARRSRLTRTSLTS